MGSEFYHLAPPGKGRYGKNHASSAEEDRQGRKSKQLCRQAAETLDLVLSGDCRDETLQSLRVLSVVPAPNSSRLLVTVGTDLPQGQVDRQSILERLAEQMGRLRCEVAASIHRRKAPSLVFNVVALARSAGSGDG
jgi:ribosome-binding factor A